MLILADDPSPQVAVLKVVLSTVLVVLALYQVSLAAVLYGKVPLPFLSRRVAARAHRAVGDMVVLVALLVGALCLSSYEVGDALEDGGRAAWHVVGGSALMVLLVVKVVVVRWGGRLGRLLPVLGSSLLVLFIVTWATSALAYLG